MRKKQELEARRQQLEMETKRRQLEELEMKRKAMEEQKRMIEEMRLKQQQQQQEQQMKMEAAAAARNAEIAKRQADIKKKQEEQQATLAIRRVVQKVRTATAENFDEMQQELATVCATELEKTGAEEKMREECQKAIEMAKGRVDAVLAARQKEVDRKAEVERLKLEQEANMLKLVQELTDLVVAAEEGTKLLDEVTTPLDESAKDEKITPAKVMKLVDAAETAGAEAKAKTKACTDFIMQRRQDLQVFKTGAPGAAGDSENKQNLSKLLTRIKEATRVADTALASAKEKKATAMKRAGALEKTKAIEAVFAKYDKDKDKMLSMKEVQAYAKGEFKFNVPQDCLKRIMEGPLVEEGKAGVAVASFHWLRATVGAARELERDMNRKKDREEKEHILIGVKDKLVEKVKVVATAVETAHKDVIKAEDKIVDMRKKAMGAHYDKHDALAAETDKVIKTSRASYEKVKKTLDGLSSIVDPKYAKDVDAFLDKEAKALKIQMKRMELRLTRASNLTTRLRDEAKETAVREIVTMKQNVIKVIRYNQRVEELTTEQIFAEIDKNGDGEIDQEELAAWLESADKELKPFKPPAADEPEAEEKKEDAEEKKEDDKAEEAKEGEAKEGEEGEGGVDGEEEEEQQEEEAEVDEEEAAADKAAQESAGATFEGSEVGAGMERSEWLEELKTTNREVQDERLLVAILCAAYPYNLAYRHKPDHQSHKTPSAQKASFDSRSVNATKKDENSEVTVDGPSWWLYSDMRMFNGKTQLVDTTLLSEWDVALFGGLRSKNGEEGKLELDNWINVSAENPKTEELLMKLRDELRKAPIWLSIAASWDKIATAATLRSQTLFSILGSILMKQEPNAETIELMRKFKMPEVEEGLHAHLQAKEEDREDIEERLRKKTVPELKVLLREMDVKDTGKKADLVTRTATALIYGKEEAEKEPDWGSWEGGEGGEGEEGEDGGEGEGEEVAQEEYVEA
mmetsp:Transcript_8661/g.30977  ORF Transcript_8661/g.30977 Transcript_8661/m.30977 type:complete len:973 (+) Transcript_8661:96-3014(+)